MIIKQLVDEDFVNYKKASMFIGFPYCTFKCEKECGVQCCQNSELALSQNIETSVEDIVNRYLSNPLTSAVVCGGLEPFDSFSDMLQLVKMLRSYTDDDVVVYTGYYAEELKEQLEALKQYKNIIVKFGRFVLNQPHHVDKVLGVELASPNQYAERIS